jgi:hypothetical protein
MINVYLRGKLAWRVLGKLIQGGDLDLEFFFSFYFGFELFIALICHFACFATFRAIC